MFYEKILTFSVFCELAILLFCTGLFPSLRKVGIIRFIIVMLGVNLFSHGIFFQTFELVQLTYVPKLIGFETLITVFEGLVYWKLLGLPLKVSLLFSLAANSASLVLGLVFL